MPNTFYPDISKYQAVIDASFDYPILCFRADSGYGTDIHAAGNYKAAKKNPKVKLCIAYVVFIKGQNSEIMSRLRSLFGKSCPAGLSFMIDMESGSGFAGGGNHSTEANELAELLAIYAGNRARVIGYANTPDWSNCWPHPPSWLKRVVARYSSTAPSISYYGWQYSDGSTKWPHPDGYPIETHPAVDMNVIHKSIDQILVDFAITKENDVSATDVITALNSAAGKKALIAALQPTIEAEVKKAIDNSTALTGLVLHGDAAGHKHNPNNLDVLGPVILEKK